MRPRTLVCASAAIAVAFMFAAACGKSSPAGPSGSTSTTTTTSTNPNTTFTISNNAVSPKSLTVSPGTRVTFVNNDNRSHDMESDPHPDHITPPIACTEINQVGFLSPGQSRETGNLNTVRTCTFHDHNDDTNTNLQGSIIIR